MAYQNEGLRVEFEPGLSEEAVLRLIETRPSVERTQFRRERDKIYTITDHELKEKRFNELHGRWFSKLGLGAQIFQVLDENQILAQAASRCLVLRARGQKEESADLLAHTTVGGVHLMSRPVVVIKVRTETLLDAEILLPLLRHELRHVADMLDPEFGYDPKLPASAPPAFDNLLRARYHVVWDATIDGRLTASGHLPAEVESLRYREFTATFTMLADSAETAFRRFFHSPRPRHEEILSFAQNPCPCEHHDPRLPTAGCLIGIKAVVPSD